jgi:hypothetical protein
MQFARTSTSGEEQFDAAVDGSTGTFVARGNAGKGIPPGHYTVTVTVGAFGMDSGKDGKPLHKQDVDIPDTGATDLVIEIRGK